MPRSATPPRASSPTSRGQRRRRASAPPASATRTAAADGSTALYASARAGVTFLRSRADDSRINAVLLLTDGKNEDADRDLDGLLASLRTEDETARVRVFTIGYGDDADRTTLQKIAEASRAAFYDASKPATIDRVFRDVVSNF